MDTSQYIQCMQCIAMKNMLLSNLSFCVLLSLFSKSSFYMYTQIFGTTIFGGIKVQTTIQSHFNHVTISCVMKYKSMQDYRDCMALVTEKSAFRILICKTICFLLTKDIRDKTLYINNCSQHPHCLEFSLKKTKKKNNHIFKISWFHSLTVSPNSRVTGDAKVQSFNSSSHTPVYSDRK